MSVITIGGASQPITYGLRCVARGDYPETLLGELPDANLKSCTWTLNAPGQMQFELANNSPNVLLPQECQNEVQVQVTDPAFGVPQTIWQGYPEKAVDDPFKVAWTCQGLLNYFNHRFVLNASFVYPTTEQMTIAGALVYWMQNTLPGQDWHIPIHSYTPSGVIRSLKYDRNDHQNALDILTDFSTYTDATGAPTGFDFDVAAPIDGSHPSARFFNMYYPRKSGPYASTIMLEYGKNITSYKVNTDGSQLANRVYYTGGSNGDIKFENNFQDDGSRGHFGEWQDVKAQSSEDSVTTLLQLAARDVYNRRAPVQVPDITVVEVPDKLLNKLFVGDTVRVRIQNGRINVDKPYRITEITWKPGPGNLQLKLAIPQEGTDYPWA